MEPIVRPIQIDIAHDQTDHKFVEALENVLGVVRDLQVVQAFFQGGYQRGKWYGAWSIMLRERLGNYTYS